uniref:Putative RNase MJ1548 n=1 Tax=Methanocaldococcus jannaschii (strain ATCC 43067 / DSM 2661 / JAL-1 / JCM 10045 / NBRC 100440) TaxID=243232 RepID=Y1548_METJA|nr:RecName: Full=Putative RNase MJ1548; AltName: Full=Putative toxin MJ1548 [Methanocaldococcus jannaschii DSM 2661]
MRLQKGLYYISLQVCVDITMDVVAMLVKDIGLNVEDDYTNIKKLLKHDVITKDEATLLKQYNRLRNAIVHKYDKIKLRSCKRRFKKN